MITNLGKVLWSKAIGDPTNGAIGTVKAKTATTLTANGAPGWTVNAFTGQDVYSGAVVGTILSNTDEILTVARWENPGSTRGGAIGVEPTVSAAFSIASGATSAAWVGISANAEAPEASNTELESELKASEGGLVRSLAVFKYIGGKEYEVKVTFTANIKDTVPVTLAKIGVFNAQNAGIMMFESLLTETADIKAVGDSIVITDIVTGS